MGCGNLCRFVMEMGVKIKCGNRCGNYVEKSVTMMCGNGFGNVCRTGCEVVRWKRFVEMIRGNDTWK